MDDSSNDLRPIMDAWPYRPGELTVRLVRGQDGKPKVQLRLDMGIMQMELDGRPDARRPHDCASLLEYHEKRLARWREEKGTEEGFRLKPSDCEALREEATMYYHRYLSLFSLQDFARAERDTERNLRAFDFVKKYAARQQDRTSMEVYRPYVLMMNARARAALSLSESKFRRALHAVNSGIEAIRKFYLEQDTPQLIEESNEIRLLEEMRKEVSAQIPPSRIDQLREQLAKAVRNEDFEAAAALRDEIRKLEREEEG
jgi:hypothetical protein